jgi:glycerol kinase
VTADLVLAIDQGSSSTRAIAFDLDLRPVASASRPVLSQHPRPGWVEQDPEEILASVVDSVAEVFASVDPRRIAAVGIDNQGETALAWDAETSQPLEAAVSWQCNRSLPIVERLRSAGHEREVQRRTGLPLTAYFSAGKMAWLIEEVPEVQRARDAGTLRLGTVDAWLTAKLAGDSLTDPSTASRTQLMDLDEVAWSPQLLELFGVAPSALPRIVESAGQLGVLRHPAWGSIDLPLTALACDQQASLAGHAAFDAGAMKATYGTGVFVLAMAGNQRPTPDARLLATVAWRLSGMPTTYAVDGGVFSAGSLLDWLVSLGILEEGALSEAQARSVPDAGGLRLLPALTGLGAPWWQPEARAVIAGGTQATRPAHIVRAALDGIVNRTADVVETMLAAGYGPDAIRVDGGLSRNAYLVERQADLLGMAVDVASATESTALGIAGLAGIGAGLIGPEVIRGANPVARRVEPRMPAAERRRERLEWRSFVEWAGTGGRRMA